MAVKSSPETIREMKKSISDTIREIERISSGIRSGLSATSGWDDSHAAQFRALMQQISRLTMAPTDTLKAALPKMERLAQALDQYLKQRF